MANMISTAFTLFWICDILNMPFMEMFDTTYPLNGWFYFLVGLLGSFFERSDK